MSTAQEAARVSDRTLEIIARPGASLEGLGAQLSFYLRALAWAPRTLRRYGKETLRLLTEVNFGTGALAVIGGTLGVMIGMTLFTGLIVGLQGYSALNQLGTAALTGFISAYFNGGHRGEQLGQPCCFSTRVLLVVVRSDKACRRSGAALS
jgi:phospholipid/cholesterol/gamma-HCH transport system permease protein